MIIINLILFALIFVILGKKGSALIIFDEKAKNIYKIKSKKYFFMEVYFILATFGTSFYIINELNGNQILEGIKLGFIFLLFTLYKRNVVNHLKQMNRIQIEEQVENIRYELSKDKKKAIKKFKSLDIKDDYKYYILTKEINSDYLEVFLLDKANSNKKYSFKIFIS